MNSTNEIANRAEANAISPAHGLAWSRLGLSALRNNRFIIKPSGIGTDEDEKQHPNAKYTSEDLLFKQTIMINPNHLKGLSLIWICLRHGFRTIFVRTPLEFLLRKSAKSK